jgi:hypothetical protein
VEAATDEHTNQRDTTAPQLIDPPSPEPAGSEPPADAQRHINRAPPPPEPPADFVPPSAPGPAPLDAEELRAHAEELRVHAERWAGRVRVHAAEPSPPPPPETKALEEVLWGLAQPGLGLRLLLRESDLMARAILPVVLYLLICAVVVFVSGAEGPWGYATAYYATLVGAAPLSPVLFTRSYAKLAAEARPYLGHAIHPPYLRSYGQALVETVVQLFVLGVGIAPVVALVAWMPLVGQVFGLALSSLWTLHWIVVEAFDSARTLPPGEDADSLEQRHALLDPPWYAGAALTRLRSPFDRWTSPLRWWGRLLARLGQRWRGEVAMVEDRPWIAVGFGAGAAVLLAIPVVNLLFRPAVVIAASHVLGHLEPREPT